MALPFVIEPTQLAALLAQPTSKLLVIDMCAEATYMQGHIDGAINVPPQKIVAAEGPVPGKIASVEKLNRLFSFLGLTPGDPQDRAIAGQSLGGGIGIGGLGIIDPRHPVDDRDQLLAVRQARVGGEAGGDLIAP